VSAERQLHAPQRLTLASGCGSARASGCSLAAGTTTAFCLALLFKAQRRRRWECSWHHKCRVQLAVSRSDVAAQAPGNRAERVRGAGGYAGYDPGKIERLAWEDPWAIAGRTLQVVWGLGCYYATLQVDELMRKSDPDIVKQRSRELRQLLLELGPVYIKVGQALANRPDIVRDDYMEELQQLQDSVPPFPTQEAMHIMREELGCDPEEVFIGLSPEPVAAASLGQVYRGRLRNTGEEVAVKVQRPGLRFKLCVDMYIFRQLAQVETFNNWAKRNLGCNITLVVDEFGAKLWEESDYIVEAANAEDFAENFKGDPTVKIPKVFRQHTGRRLITMEWIDGVKSTDLVGLKSAQIDLEAFIRNGVQAALRQLLEFGLFHGDPHAGNVFAMQDGRIAYVDFGNVATITAQQRSVIVCAITHVANSEYKEIANNDFVRLGFLRPGTDTTEIVPAIGDIWVDSLGTSIRDFNFRTVTASFSKLVYRFPVRIPERFSLVFRALLQQEGICICINPEFSIIEVALPFASKRLLSDPDPTLLQELQSIVIGEENGRPVFRWDRMTNLVTLAKQARDGSSIRFDDVIVEFFRRLRRDLVREGNDAPIRLSQALRSGLQSLFAGKQLQLGDARQVLELIGPDLTPELARRVADSLVRDSLQELLKEKGVEVDAADLMDPRKITELLASPEQLRRLLPPLPLPS